ncbi:hypothetical protein M3Y98_01044700 [Aphelenchoides besseyi]|nr:hypothetical protein M3Y98_01044700 [Aphelenchoides besseyi]
MRHHVCLLALLALTIFTADAGVIRQKRQLLGYGLGSPLGYGLGGPLGGYGGLGYGLGGFGGLTPGQAIADRNLMITQANTRRALLNSQMLTNQARMNTLLLGR